MASFHKDFTIETVEEDEERVAFDETFNIESSLNNVEMELTNDCADMWVKGVETQETAFKNLMVHTSLYQYIDKEDYRTKKVRSYK